MTRPAAYRVMLEVGAVSDLARGALPSPAGPRVTLQVDPVARMALVRALDLGLDLHPSPPRNTLAKPGSGWKLDFLLQLILARCRDRDSHGRLIAASTSATELYTGDLSYGAASWGRNNVRAGIQLLEDLGVIHRSQRQVGSAGDITVLDGPSDEVSVYTVGRDAPAPTDEPIWRPRRPVDNVPQPVDDGGSPEVRATSESRWPEVRATGDPSWPEDGAPEVGGAEVGLSEVREGAGQQVVRGSGVPGPGPRPHDDHVMDDSFIFGSFHDLAVRARSRPEQLGALLRHGQSQRPPVTLGWTGDVDLHVARIGPDHLVEALFRLDRKLATDAAGVANPGAWLRKTAERLSAEASEVGVPAGPSAGPGDGGSARLRLPVGAGPQVLGALASAYDVDAPPSPAELQARADGFDEATWEQLVWWAAREADRRVSARQDPERLDGPPEWVMWLCHFLDGATATTASPR